MEAKTGEMMDMVFNGIELATAGGLAVPWGSYPMPGDKGVKVTKANAKVAKAELATATATLAEASNSWPVRKLKLKNKKKKAEINAKIAEENVVAAKAAAVTNHQNIRPGMMASDFFDPVGKAVVRSGTAAVNAYYEDDESGTADLGDENDKYLLKEEDYPGPDPYGTNHAELLQTYEEYSHDDCSAIQQGFSRVMCDMYCTEDAVRAGNRAVLKSIQGSNDVLTANLDQLLDYHSQLQLWGMGQLKDQITEHVDSKFALLQSSEDVNALFALAVNASQALHLFVCSFGLFSCLRAWSADWSGQLLVPGLAAAWSWAGFAPARPPRGPAAEPARLAPAGRRAATGHRPRPDTGGDPRAETQGRRAPGRRPRLEKGGDAGTEGPRWSGR